MELKWKDTNKSKREISANDSLGTVVTGCITTFVLNFMDLW